MVLNHKPTGTAVSMPVGLLHGGIVSFVITIGTSAILAFLLNRERTQWETAGYWIMGMILAASMAGSYTANRKIKRQKMLVSAMSGAVYLLELLAITALFFGGQYEAVGVTAFLIFGGSISAGLLGLREGKSCKRRIRHR